MAGLRGVVAHNLLSCGCPLVRCPGEAGVMLLGIIISRPTVPVSTVTSGRRLQCFHKPGPQPIRNRPRFHVTITGGLHRLVIICLLYAPRRFVSKLSKEPKSAYRKHSAPGVGNAFWSRLWVWWWWWWWSRTVLQGLSD